MSRQRDKSRGAAVPAAGALREAVPSDDPRSFSGPVELLHKGLARVAASRPLVALPPEPGVPALFRSLLPGARYQYLDYAVYRRDRELGAGGAELVFSSDFRGDGGHDLAAVFLPKSVPLIEYVFSQVSAALGPGAPVLIVGANKSGIRSSKKLIEQYIGAVAGSQSGSHSVLLTARKEVDAAPYAGEETYRVAALGRELEIVTLPGTFSYGRLDEGTELLLEHLGPLEFGRALDFGCGAGVIGAALQLAAPGGRVELVDSNAMALESARRTLVRNGLDPAAVQPSDVLSGVRGTFDLIVSNPPFHTGLQTDFLVTQELIETAGRHLAREGRLVLVANAFINYFQFLRPLFAEVETLAENRKFRVIQARHPRRAGDRRQ
jgi:16S rRNA (guanine1207-N2)-methyltransferase